MKQVKLFLLLYVVSLSLSSCVSLKRPTATFYSPFQGYKYIYIAPTTEKHSVEGGLYGGPNGIYGITTSSSINPSDLISGHFLKKGYIRVQEITPENADKTIIVNYGEDNNGELFLSKRIGVIIQMISADKNEIICICTGEAEGLTDAEAITKAINLAMNEFFR